MSRVSWFYHHLHADPYQDNGGLPPDGPDPNDPTAWTPYPLRIIPHKAWSAYPIAPYTFSKSIGSPLYMLMEEGGGTRGRLYLYTHASKAQISRNRKLRVTWHLLAGASSEDSWRLIWRWMDGALESADFPPDRDVVSDIIFNVPGNAVVDGLVSKDIFFPDLDSSPWTSSSNSFLTMAAVLNDTSNLTSSKHECYIYNIQIINVGDDTVIYDYNLSSKSLDPASGTVS